MSKNSKPNEHGYNACKENLVNYFQTPERFRSLVIRLVSPEDETRNRQKVVKTIHDDFLNLRYLRQLDFKRLKLVRLLLGL